MKREYDNLVKQILNEGTIKNIKYVFEKLKILEKIKFFSFIYSKEMMKKLDDINGHKIKKGLKFTNKDFEKLQRDVYAQSKKDIVNKLVRKDKQNLQNLYKKKMTKL